MSHVSQIDLHVTDLDLLEKSCEDLGLELTRDQTTYAWWGVSVGDTPLPAGRTAAQLGSCAHAIKVKGTNPRLGGVGPWEIGVVARTDGKPGFRLEYDSWGMHGRALEAKAGTNLVALKREYATQVTKRHLARQGYRVRVTDENGVRQVIGER